MAPWPDDPSPAPPAPSPTEVALRRAGALVEAGRWEQALRTVHEVLASDPGNPLALRTAAVAELRLGRYAAALAAADAAVGADPGEEHGHRLASLALEALGRHEQAVAAAREAVRLEPGEPYALSQLATVLSARRATRAEAVAVAERAVASGPGLTQPLFVLGLVHHRRGRHRRARRAYEAVLALDPQHADALNNLGAMALNRNRLGRGAELLGGSLALDPHSAVARHNVDVLAVGLARRVWVGALLAVLAVAFAGAAAHARGSVVPWRWVVLVVAWGLLAAWVGPTWRRTPPALRHAVRERVRARPVLVVAWVVAALLLLASLAVALLPASTVTFGVAAGVVRVAVVVNLVVWFALRRSRPRE